MERGLSSQAAGGRRQGLPAPQLDWAVFLDVDGTLIEIAATPDQIDVPADMLAAVEGVRKALDGAVAIVSGRPLNELDRMFAPLQLPAAGLHGLEWRTAQGQLVTEEGEVEALRGVREKLLAFADTRRGVVVEDKRLSLALHYRNAPEAADDAKSLVTTLVAEQAGQLGVIPGKMVLEIKPKHMDKGTVVEAFMAAPPFRGRVPVFVGDDFTDEYGFRMVNRMGGHSIRVGPPPPDVVATQAVWDLEHSVFLLNMV